MMVTKHILKRLFWPVCFLSLPLIVWAAHPAEAKKEKKEIFIGSNTPLSGNIASLGFDHKWAYEAAVEDINKAGGIYVREYGKKLPVKLLIIDDESDPGKAAATVERLIKHQKVDLLLGGATGPFSVIPGCVTAEKYRKYYHTSACMVEPWRKYKFTWSTLFFFDMAQMASIPYLVWNTLPEDQRIKKPAAFLEDTQTGRGFGNLLRKKADEYGYKYVLFEPWAVGAKDFSAQIIKAKSLGADAIIIMGGTPDCITFVRQLKENRYMPKYLHGVKGTWQSEFWKALGKDANYVLTDGHWSLDFPMPGARELGERYYKRFNKYSIGVGSLYGLCQVLFEAIEKAGTLDSAKVRQAVLDNEFDTVIGKANYGEDGVALYEACAFQWIDGRQETVYPFKYTKYKVRLAPPWDQR